MRVYVIRRFLFPLIVYFFSLLFHYYFGVASLSSQNELLDASAYSFIVIIVNIIIKYQITTWFVLVILHFLCVHPLSPLTQPVHFSIFLIILFCCFAVNAILFNATHTHTVLYIIHCRCAVFLHILHCYIYIYLDGKR